MIGNLSFDDLEPVDMDKYPNVEKTPNDMFIITNEFIVAGMSGNGGFNYEQLRLLGVETPPKNGWKERIIGKSIPRDVAQKYLALKGHSNTVAKQEKIIQIQNELLGTNPEIQLTEEDKSIIRYCVEDCYRMEIEKGNTNRVQKLKQVLDKLIYLRDQK